MLFWHIVSQLRASHTIPFSQLDQIVKLIEYLIILFVTIQLTVMRRSSRLNLSVSFSFLILLFPVQHTHTHQPVKYFLSSIHYYEIVRAYTSVFRLLHMNLHIYLVSSCRIINDSCLGNEFTKQIMRGKKYTQYNDRLKITKIMKIQTKTEISFAYQSIKFFRCSSKTLYTVEQLLSCFKTLTIFQVQARINFVCKYFSSP